MDVVGKPRVGNVYTILFVYTPSTTPGDPKVLRMLSQEADRWIEKQTSPMIIHRLYYWPINNPAMGRLKPYHTRYYAIGLQRKYTIEFRPEWEYHSTPTNIRLRRSKRKSFRMEVREQGTGQVLLCKKMRRIPRSWIRELDSYR